MGALTVFVPEVIFGLKWKMKRAFTIPCCIAWCIFLLKIDYLYGLLCKWQKGENMKEKKVVLKKVNRTNNSTVRTLACHCSCEGSGIRAVGKGYIAGFF